MKKQIDEYENKIKKLIREFEDESKKHIKEVSELHEQCRMYKGSSQELEQRIKHYKSDYDRAVQAEREAKKEVVRVTLENDEIREKAKFLEQRYQSMIHKLGISPDDIQALEEQLMHEDSEAQYVQQKSGQKSHSKSKSKEKQHPFQKVVNVRQAKQDQLQIEDYDEEESNRHGNPTDRRSESRLERRRNDEVVDSYDYYGDQQEEEDQITYTSNQKAKPKQHGVISGEQIIEQSDVNKVTQNSKKKTQIEVLDDDTHIDYYTPQDEDGHEVGGDSESGDLLKKLIENLSGNPALQNEYIKEQFKLDQIKGEEDLHNYKNLLNSMAALFYTNHRMNDVTLFFYMWKEAAIAKL